MRSRSCRVRLAIGSRFFLRTGGECRSEVRQKNFGRTPPRRRARPRRAASVRKDAAERFDSQRVGRVHATKLAFLFQNDLTKPRRMPELRHAKTGEPETTASGKLRFLGPGEKRWIVIEACNREAPGFYIDGEGKPSPARLPGTTARKSGLEPGSAVYWKKTDDAEEHWRRVPHAENQSRVEEARKLAKRMGAESGESSGSASRCAWSS